MDTSNMNIDELYQYGLALCASSTRLTDALALLERVDEDIEEFQGTMEFFDTGLCVMCPQEAFIRDVLNIPWCAEHQTRGDFVNIMAARRWQEIIGVEFEEEHGTVNYSIATGAYFTANVALVGSDEAITALALAAIVREERAA